MIRMFKVSLLIGALITSTVLVWASPAHAASFDEYNQAVAWDNPRNFISCTGKIATDQARGCLWADGDYFIVQDKARDGKRVGVQWRLKGGDRSGMCYTTAGPIDPVFDGPGMECNKDLPENAVVEYRVGTCDNQAAPCKTTSSWGQWSAWTSKRA